MATASPFLFWSFVGLPLLLAAAFVAGVYAAGRRTGLDRAAARRLTAFAATGTVLWLAATFGLAASGRLSFATTPPTMMLLLAANFVVAFGIGFSRLGRRLAAGLPLAALVGFQGFRLPLELLMHRAYTEGLMPVQMSYAGLNFDILTGLTALAVGALLAAGRMPRWGVRLWNGLGLVLLANIVTIAFLSAPTPLRVFHNEPANVWITQAPWVWLPTVMVLAALVGHLLVFRRLRMERAAPATTPPVRA